MPSRLSWIMNLLQFTQFPIYKLKDCEKKKHLAAVEMRIRKSDRGVKVAMSSAYRDIFL